MFPLFKRRQLLISFAALGLLTACSAGTEATGSISLEDTAPDEVDADTDTEPSADAEANETDETEAEADQDGNDRDAEGDDTASADEADVVDLTQAVPGTWPVGDAGTVTFAITDGALVLEDVSAADGWRADIDEEDPDEIEVDFRSENIEWEIEIELEDGGTTLEIEIDQDIENADPGTYDVGDAGTFSFEVEDGQLVLTDLQIADGWTQAELDEEADEIEFELVNGPRQFDVEVELEQDGTIEIEIDYEVVGPIDG